MKNPLRSLKAPPPAATLPSPPTLKAATARVHDALAKRQRVQVLGAELELKVRDAAAKQRDLEKRVSALSLELALAEDDARAEPRQRVLAARDELTEIRGVVEHADEMRAGVAAKLSEADDEIEAAGIAFREEFGAFRRAMAEAIEADLAAAAAGVGAVMARVFAQDPAVVGVGLLRLLGDETVIPSVTRAGHRLLGRGHLLEGRVALATAWTDDHSLVALRESQRALGDAERAVAPHLTRIDQERRQRASKAEWTKSTEHYRPAPALEPLDPPPRPAPGPKKGVSYVIRAPGTPAPANEIGITGPHRVSPETGEQG